MCEDSEFSHILTLNIFCFILYFYYRHSSEFEVESLMALTFISLMINGAKHIFMESLATLVSFLVYLYSNFFVHF